jgi:hypothetical protein
MVAFSILLLLFVITVLQVAIICRQGDVKDAKDSASHAATDASLARTNSLLAYEEVQKCIGYSLGARQASEKVLAFLEPKKWEENCPTCGSGVVTKESDAPLVAALRQCFVPAKPKK